MIECYYDMCDHHEGREPFCSLPDCKVIQKEDLMDHAFYKGSCRNATVAWWDAKNEVFHYMRQKFGDCFEETIKYLTDDEEYDVFVPYERLAECFNCKSGGCL